MIPNTISDLLTCCFIKYSHPLALFLKRKLISRSHFDFCVSRHHSCCFHRVPSWKQSIFQNFLLVLIVELAGLWKNFPITLVKIGKKVYSSLQNVFHKKRTVLVRFLCPPPFTYSETNKSCLPSPNWTAGGEKWCLFIWVGNSWYPCKRTNRVR